MIHNTLLYGGTIAVVSMFAVILHVFEGYVPKAEARTDEELCQELVEVVDEFVDSELLSQAEADAIVERCYNLFVRRNQ